MKSTGAIAALSQNEKNDQFRRVLGLWAWMRHCNNDANIHYASFRRTDYPVGYTEPNKSFLVTQSAAYPDNVPTINDFLELMQFIRAVNENNTRDLPAGVASTNFAMYVNNDFSSLNFSILQANNDPGQAERLQLANEMLNELTEFRKYGFDRFDEGDLSTTDQTAYDRFSALHAIALDRRGSGKFEDEGQFWIKGGRRALKSVIAVLTFPILIMIGGVFSLINLTGYRPKEGSYGHWIYSVFSSAFFRMDAGSKYWAQAGFDSPANGAWMSSAFFRKFLGSIQIFLATLPEIFVKALFFPFKWAFEYDQWRVDGYARRTVDALESTLIGILSLPVIIVNHFYAAVVNVFTKLFGAHKDDTSLIGAKTFFKDWLDVDLELTKPTGWDLCFILPYKAFRFLLGAIPDIFSQVITNTLRSVLPAMPFTTKEGRDKLFHALELSIYSTIWVIQALFLGTLIAVALGAVVPAGLAALFGASTTHGLVDGGVHGFVTAYGNQIWGILQTIGNGAYSLVSSPVDFFARNLNPANLNSIYSSAKGVFGQLWEGIKGIQAIENWSAASWVIAGAVTAALPFVAFFVGKLVPKWYDKYQKDKNASYDDKLVPDAKASRTQVNTAFAKPSASSAAPVKLQQTGVHSLFGAQLNKNVPPLPPSSTTTSTNTNKVPSSRTNGPGSN